MYISVAHSPNFVDVSLSEEVSFRESMGITSAFVTLKGGLVFDGIFYIFSGNLTADCVLNCDLCLQDVPFTTSIEISEKFANNSTDPDVFHCGDIIDFYDLICTNLLPALPMKVLCHEACLGLCPICGNNKNQTNCHCGNAGFDTAGLERYPVSLQALKSLFNDKEV